MTEELSKELLEVIACPDCHSELTYDKKAGKLLCKKCSKEFRIENGIPNMLSGE